jgi:signal transduction histidine kinase
VYNPKTVRASAGSVFHLPIVRGVATTDAISSLRERGTRVLAMDAGGEVDLDRADLAGPIAFILGNEASGLPEDVRALADATVRVPLAGAAESLNLAAAATVCLFEWARRHREGGGGSLETIIAAAAHDIRSPLTAMKGFGHALAKRWEQMSVEQRSLMLEGIVYDTDRLNAIVGQLVDAARLAAGTIEFYPESIDVAAVVHQVADSLARDPDHPPILWEGSELTAFVDRERLRLVLEAFIESLVWWTSDGPVRVTGTVDGGRLIVALARDGSTLPAGDAGALFHPREPGSGAGSKIGLFVARGLAEAQGGSVRASVDGGLRFVLEVPIRQA